MRKLLLVALLGLGATLPLAGCVPVVAAGVGAGAMVADDRRSTGTYLDDENIELKAAGRFHDAKLDGVHASFTSFNHRLLITGQASTEALKDKVGEIARKVPGVKEMFNELTIAKPVDFGTRSSDSFITAKVKTRFLGDKRFNANHVKVVTEDGVVYLMGLVKHDEANAAAEVAAKTSGVKRVVKVFEYID
jgi:osmotically-inducible protein OsmY